MSDPKKALVDASSRWLTVAEACLYVRCSQQYLRKLIHDGELRASRFASGFRIDRVDLDNLLLRRKRVISPYRKNTHPWVSARHAAARKEVA